MAGIRGSQVEIPQMWEKMEITEFLRRPNGTRQPITFLADGSFVPNHLLTLCDGLRAKTYKKYHAEKNLYVEYIPTVIFDV